MRFGAFRLIIPVALVLVAAPLAARAQQAGKVYRIGYLSTDSKINAAGPPRPFLEGLRQINLKTAKRSGSRSRRRCWGGPMR